MNIFLKSLLFYCLGAALVAALIFVPAGTLDYWQGWLYLSALFVPMTFVMAYFLATDREFLQRRFQAKEKEKVQQRIQLLSAPLFLIGFLLPGLGKRFGWLDVPADVSIAASAFVFVGYCAVFWVFRTNSFAGRTIRVVKGQTVVSTGPYAIVRHPMYAAFSTVMLATPFALGLYAALVPFLLYMPLLAMRIRNEEEVLCRELKGYKEYCRKVKFRLVPGVW